VAQTRFLDTGFLDQVRPAEMNDIAVNDGPDAETAEVLPN